MRVTEKKHGQKFCGRCDEEYPAIFQLVSSYEERGSHRKLSPKFLPML